jgi:hypothetical protein
MNIISSTQAKSIIDEQYGKFFSVVFIKKNGEIREMNCRQGVKAFLKGGTLKFDPQALGYVVVFDIQKMAYRMVNLNTLRGLKIDGKEYHVVDQK